MGDDRYQLKNSRCYADGPRFGDVAYASPGDGRRRVQQTAGTSRFAVGWRTRSMIPPSGLA